MAREKPELLYVTWRRLHNILIELAYRIRDSNKTYDTIYAVVKGGLIPARIMADLLDVDEIGFIGARFYKGVSTHKAKPELFLPPTTPLNNKSILVVDDVVDTGRTLQLVIEELYRYGAERVETLAIYVKPWTIVYPDYYYKVTDKWIIYPWEIAETLKEITPPPEIFKGDLVIYRSVEGMMKNTL